MNGIDVVIDALIHALHPSGYKDLPLQGLGAIGGSLLLQFVNQLMTFLHRDKPTGLDSIHQQLQFRQLEVPFAQIVSPPTLEDNIIPLLAQNLHVCIHALSFRQDPVGLELVQQLWDRQRMIFIALPLEDMKQKQELLLVLIF